MSLVREPGARTGGSRPNGTAQAGPFVRESGFKVIPKGNGLAYERLVIKIHGFPLVDRPH
jgi:hypothetical protein